MIKMSLCYIIDNHKWLMMLRNKKENDINANKWIGVGGKIEENESPREGVIREIKEETGLIPNDLVFRGILYFSYGTKDSEKIWVYSCHSYDRTLKECDEGTLEWIDEDKVLNLELWEGDHIFLERMINSNDKFCIELKYDDDGNFIEYKFLEEETE